MKMALLNSSKEEYFDFLRFATVSADPARAQTMRECASWLEREFGEGRVEAEIVSAQGAPVVLAEWKKQGGGKRRTVLLYGHYDVQPGEMGDG